MENEHLAACAEKKPFCLKTEYCLPMKMMLTILLAMVGHTQRRMPSRVLWLSQLWISSCNAHLILLTVL